MKGRPKSDPTVRGYPLTIKLFELADKMEWTTQQYAAASGMNYQRLCRIRQGKQEPSLHNLIQMADVFELRIGLIPNAEGVPV